MTISASPTYIKQRELLFQGAYHNNQNPRWTRKPCVPVGFYTPYSVLIIVFPRDRLGGGAFKGGPRNAWSCTTTQA